ncbi:MAG: hypothetical protein Q7R95_06940, partial [bacterium]|nr:hypothetical protein [bacterium]
MHTFLYCFGYLRLLSPICNFASSVNILPCEHFLEQHLFIRFLPFSIIAGAFKFVPLPPLYFVLLFIGLILYFLIT